MFPDRYWLRTAPGEHRYKGGALMKDYLNIEGLTAVVTGGATGIGRGVSLAFSEFGVKVAVVDINEADGRKTVEDIRNNGGIAEFYYCDVTEPAEVNETIRKIAEELDSVDILFSNAGIGDKNTNVEDITDEQWNRMLKTDLFAAFYFSKAVLPYMRERGRGRIIINSSGSGVIGVELISHYGAAKAGLIGFAMSIAKEVAAENITVNAIATPTTVTPQFIDADYEELPFIPMKRFAYPEDIANLVLFLSSDRASYITGQIIAPNGGRRTPI